MTCVSLVPGPVELWGKLLRDDEPKCRKVGRPRDLRKDIALIVDVNRLKLERNRSDSEAISVLTKSPRFAGRWSGENVLTLRNKLSAARKDKAIDGILRRAEALGVDLWALVDRTVLKNTPENAEKKRRPTITRPPKPSEPNDPQSEDELTAEEREALRRARAMFQ